jgi:MFS family permease
VVLCVRLFGARLPDRLGASKAGTAATLLVAAGLGTVAAYATVGGLYAGTIVLGMGMALQYPALMAMAVNRADDRERAAVVGTFTAFFDLAQGAGGIILGGVAAIGGYRASFAGGAVCAILALATLRLRVVPQARRDSHAPHGDLLAEPTAWMPPGAD